MAIVTIYSPIYRDCYMRLHIPQYTRFYVFILWCGVVKRFGPPPPSSPHHTTHFKNPNDIKEYLFKLSVWVDRIKWGNLNTVLLFACTHSVQWHNVWCIHSARAPIAKSNRHTSYNWLMCNAYFTLFTIVWLHFAWHLVILRICFGYCVDMCVQFHFG